jgi:hypothetical protein
MNFGHYQSWSNQTNLHPLAGVAMCVLGLAMVLVPRRYATWPMIFMACFIAPAQRVVIATVDFDLLRIMVMFGWARVILRAEYADMFWRPLDKLIIVWSLYHTTTITLLSGGFSGFLNAAGDSFDALGMYFLFRALIRDWGDVKRAVSGFIWASIPVAAAFVVESRTGRNLFAFLGGVPAFTLVRDDRLRCQGAFAHPILAGCFWASVMPLMAVQLLLPGRKLMPLVGCATSLFVIVLCNSSTPLAGLTLAVIALPFYFLHRHMRLVRWCILLSLLCLHFLLMKAPVWHLLSRIDLSGGSANWHRQNLIDQAVKHWHEWWLVGSSVGSAHWSFGTVDVTNLYIVQCLHGGLALLALFLTVISLGFRDVGHMLRCWQHDRAGRYIAWALGICLLIHVMNFVGVSYFGQINLVWYQLLAVISSLAAGAGVVRVGIAAAPAARAVVAAPAVWPRRRPRPSRSRRRPARLPDRCDETAFEQLDLIDERVHQQRTEPDQPVQYVRP